MSVTVWFVLAYFVGGAVMFWFSKDLQHDSNKAYRLAVIWPMVVVWAGAWLTLSFGIIVREHFSHHDVASSDNRSGTSVR